MVVFFAWWKHMGMWDAGEFGEFVMHSSFCNAVHLVARRKISLLMVIMGLGLVIGVRGENWYWSDYWGPSWTWQ